MKTTAISCILTAELLLVPFIGAGAFGQSIAAAPADRVATNLAGATTSIAPPEGFDALSAADEDLAKYGFPPRPDANTNVAAYSKWRKAMLAAKTRVAPQLETTQHFHGPKRDGSDNFDGTATSNNWSGPVAFGGASSYNNHSTFKSVSADYVVPVATQAYGTCGGTDYESSWVGIDGFDSDDVLQAGTESDAYCYGSTTTGSYYAWYEWYPYAEVRIANLAVSPGDDIYVDVWHTSATTGFAFIVNLNTNQYVPGISFSAPPGTSLVGNSAEWIVERPTVNGALATLPNYVADYFSSAYAYTESGKEYKPSSSGSLLVTMLDANGNPISVPTQLGNDAIEFQAVGSAQ